MQMHGANRTNRKRRTHHGGNQPNRDQKIPLSHCFSVIWCAAGARGIARFEKVLWEKEYFCMAFQCMFGKQLHKRFVSRHCSLPAYRHTEQNRSAKRKQFSRKSSSLDNPHSRYSNKTLFSQRYHLSIVEGRFIVLVSLVLFCHRPWPWPPWRKNFLEFVLVHVSAVDSWLIPFSGRKQRENSSARSNWFVPRKHR